MNRASGIFGSLVSFDLETTGLCVAQGREVEAIQIGAVMLDQATLVPSSVRFERKLRIEHPERIEDGVLGKWNHFDQETWDREAVSQRQGWQDFADWLFAQPAAGGVVKPRFLGQNIGKFDYPLTMSWCSHFGINLHHDYHLVDYTTAFDVFKRLANVQRWGLSLERDACPTFGLSNPKAHDALADAVTCGLCFALQQAWLTALVEVGQGHQPEAYLEEAYRRIGHPRVAGIEPLRSLR